MAAHTSLATIYRISIFLFKRVKIFLFLVKEAPIHRNAIEGLGLYNSSVVDLLHLVGVCF